VHRNLEVCRATNVAYNLCGLLAHARKSGREFSYETAIVGAIAIEAPYPACGVWASFNLAAAAWKADTQLRRKGAVEQSA
jgi:hypothetical protein